MPEKSEPTLPKVAVIPPEIWKKNRDRMSTRVRRGLHLIETNPGAQAKHLRFDYILTAAEVRVIVERVMRDTERLTLRYAR